MLSLAIGSTIIHDQLSFKDCLANFNSPSGSPMSWRQSKKVTRSESLPIDSLEETCENFVFLSTSSFLAFAVAALIEGR
jgi:hypothetical protein